jgi:hypothetical protein
VVDPPIGAGGVVLHATNAADKLLMLKTLDLYDYEVYKKETNIVQFLGIVPLAVCCFLAMAVGDRSPLAAQRGD